MRRREFIGFVGGVLASPIAARAQQPAKVAHVGYLGFGTPAAAATRIEALRAGLNGSVMSRVRTSLSNSAGPKTPTSSGNLQTSWSPRMLISSS